jgi:hypothetical protein
MKYILTPFLLLSLVSSLSAQPEKGTWILGGNASAAYYSQKEHYGYNIYINPSGGYFITDRVALLLRASTGFDKAGTNYGTDNNYYYDWSYGVGPGIKIYFLKLGKGALYTEAAMLYARWHTVYNRPAARYEYSTYVYKATLGYEYFLNKNTGLSAGLTYDEFLQTGQTRSGSLYFLAGFNIYFKKEKQP